MDDPNNHLETIYPSLPEMVEHMGNLCESKYPFSLNTESVHYLYEFIKLDILVRLHSCDAMDAHNKFLHNISLETKRTMCFQKMEAIYFDCIIIQDSEVVAYNSDRHKPWCMQEWLLPGLGHLPNAFIPRFDFRSLSQSLRVYAKARNIRAHKNSFSYCYHATSGNFCELLFMYLLVKHEDMSIEQMMRDHRKYQLAYELYACRQWRAKHEAPRGPGRAMIPLIAADLVIIDAIDD